MKSIADQLPPEIARQIHPDRRKNEAAYWAVRDQLLDPYRGQWIGFADGVVIASGSSPVAVFHAAEASGRHPFIICVGREEEPCRIRRVAWPYDASYPGEALPLISVEFRPPLRWRKTMTDKIRCEITLYWSEVDQAFIAEAPELPGCAADGATYQEAVAHVEVAIQEWIETAQELGRPIPKHHPLLMIY
jgi:predicted RNase H-like HicB family nuclease